MEQIIDKEPVETFFAILFSLLPGNLVQGAVVDCRIKERPDPHLVLKRTPFLPEFDEHVLCNVGGKSLVFHIPVRKYAQ